MTRLAFACAALTLATVALLVAAPSRASAQEAAIGIGPAVHPFVCGYVFDARVTNVCSWRHGPLPGGDRYCPLHGPAR